MLFVAGGCRQAADNKHIETEFKHAAQEFWGGVASALLFFRHESTGRISLWCAPFVVNAPNESLSVVQGGIKHEHNKIIN